MGIIMPDLGMKDKDALRPLLRCRVVRNAADLNCRYKLGVFAVLREAYDYTDDRLSDAGVQPSTEEKSGSGGIGS